MSTAAQEALANRFHRDIMEKGDLAVADEIIAPDFVWHAPGLPPELSPGPGGVKQFVIMFRTAFPDVQATHDDTISAGDKVVIRWTLRATHQGEFMGIPPTGRQVTVGGIDIFRAADGQLAELWQFGDQFGLLQQLGVIPMPEQAGT